MDNFIYEVPTKVYFGKNEDEKVGALVAAFKPHKVLLHYGGASAEKSGLLARVRKSLTEAGVAFVELGGVQANPTLEMVRKGIALCQAEGVDFVLSVGGGSVMDSSKDIANGVANPETDVWDFSLGKAVPTKTLHKGCILTLAAAGSEMSNSCVITNEATEEKRGYGCSLNRFDFAIENPELTYSVSRYQTACGAVDIAMHSIERFFCPGTDCYLTDNVALAVIKSAMKAGKDAYMQPHNKAARENMMWASSLAHNGLTQCGKSFQLIVHQMEHELSGMYPKIAHGAGLAALWCSWARYVCDEPENQKKFLQYGEEVWGIKPDLCHRNETIRDIIDRQEAYYRSIGMPTDIQSLGVKKEDLEVLALRCSRNKSRSLMGHRPLDYEDILAIYCMAYERPSEFLPFHERIPDIVRNERPEGEGPLTVCIGDSITYGSGVKPEREKCFVSLLNQFAGGAEQFWNFGISGGTLLQNTDRPYPYSMIRYAETLKPERVMLMLGTNDSKYFFWNAEAYEQELRRMLDEFSAWGSVKEVVVMLPPWCFIREGEREVAAGVDMKNLTEGVLPILKRVAKNCRIIDLYTLTEGHREYSDDGLHPNALGNQVIAEYIWKKLKK